MLFSSIILLPLIIMLLIVSFLSFHQEVISYLLSGDFIRAHKFSYQVMSASVDTTILLVVSTEL